MDHSGFEEVTTLDDARGALRDICVSHGRTEACSVEDADGRILASPVRAGRDVPHYDRAAMDGYAVRAADTFDASDRSPIDLRLAEDSVDPGTASQVHTGSAIPDGADAVAMVEFVEQDGSDLTVYDAVAVGENVAPAGEDVDADEHLFDAGHRLHPSDLALLRAADIEEVEVAARPRVSVVPTGEELVEPGTEPGAGEIVETNGLLVSQLVERWGGDPSYRDVVTDDEDALRAAISRDLDHDIVVTNGGSSVGERDLIGSVVADMGEVLVHGVDIKPGHPVGFGIVEDTPVLMLPGYPVSCLVNAVQFLRPAVAWLAGSEPPRLPAAQARLSAKLRSAPGERTFARVRLDERADEDADPPLTAEPVRVGGAGVMSSVAFADGWVVIPESLEGIPAGEVVTVQQWEGPY
jgi:molybdopterin molybdotransferase